MVEYSSTPNSPAHPTTYNANPYPPHIFAQSKLANQPNLTSPPAKLAPDPQVGLTLSILNKFKSRYK